MYPILNALHSYNRYFLLAALAFVLFRSISGWLGKKPYEKADNAGAAALLGFTHLQALIGLILYFGASPIAKTALEDFGAAMKNPWLRYIAVEHISAMLIAVVLIQLGRTFSKKAASDEEKHKKLAIYTAIAAVIIFGTLAMKGLLIGSLASVTGG